MIEFPSRKTIHRLRRQYPVGTRVRLVSMDDKYRAMPAGLRGTVYMVDDMGTIHIDWDNGSMLGAVYGVDEIEKVVSE